MSGSVGRNVEVNDDELGTVVSGDLSPAKARVLLKLALLQSSDAAKVQEIFETY
jgi:L-asparaginase